MATQTALSPQNKTELGKKRKVFKCLLIDRCLRGRAMLRQIRGNYFMIIKDVSASLVR